MPTYRTPDVYVEEISVFPPSVAEVETAIPAFIGYTARATRIVDGDLVNVPTRIKSLLEYETLFGGGPAIEIAEVVIDEANNFISAGIRSSYYLYDSLRLFFDNGGGDCYIVSVGGYGDDVDRDALKGGVEEVRKFDEPTILLFPDAATLEADDLAAVQQAALNQCGRLGDRVAILDTRSDDPHGEDLRDTIGMNDLKYGAAYTPWLKINYGKRVGYAEVKKSAIRKRGTSVTLQDLTADPDLLALMKGIDSVQTDIDGLARRIADATGETAMTAAAHQGELRHAYLADRNPGTMATLFAYLYKLAGVVDGMVVGTKAVANARLEGDIEGLIASTLRPAYEELIALEEELSGRIPEYALQWDKEPVPSAEPWQSIFEDKAPGASSDRIPASGSEADMLDAALSGIDKAFATVSGVLDSIATGAAAYRRTYEQSLYDNFSVYRNLIKGINNTLTTCPPSGAIAGIYALVDAQRGVWKAPANVSLNGVLAPTVHFDRSDTDRLNIDPVAGKSINAIRTFAGKGTLVWGARTLAGNDNEWRYIPVRRFYNMVEEATKKSTSWAVFEPNDANTWVKVRGMIENYLTQKWREGALAGATTKDAFFVRCGLGVTMSPQDILEGRMIVEIGMAVVRPAEFLILRFSHKVQNS